MTSKRAGIIVLLLTACFLGLAARFLYLQVYAADSLSKAASAQRMNSASVEKPRGNILDRNGIPFTNRTKKYTIVMKPLYLKDHEEDIIRVGDILDLDSYQLQKQLEINPQPILMEASEEQKEALRSMKLEGISIINSLKRYDDSAIARHVTGYLNKRDQVGQTGIEKAFEKDLNENRKSTIGVIMDARNNLVAGLGYRIQKDEGEGKKLDVCLTLDYHIQRIAEEVMDRNGITGAVVIEDVNTGDIVAMASKPDFDQESVDKYLDSPNKELFNRATAAYNIGSVFKILVAGAILDAEPEALDEKYVCQGSIMIGDREFKCSSYKNGGHGEVDFEQAFARSCNPYFINLGLRIGYRGLIEIAEAFGMGSCTGIREQGVFESKGNLPPADSSHSDGDIANLSIGQGAMMATPVQVADLVATIANGGIKNRVNLVDRIIDQDGQVVRVLKSQDGKRVLPKEAVDQVKKLMEAVTDYGTGQSARLELYGGAAGKTGSAETGRKEIVHAWFAGYFPRSQPRYAMAVLIENGQYGGKVAGPVFAEIAEEMMKKGL